MSVNSGTIVLNVSGKTRTFVDVKLVSAVGGKIVLDLPSFKLTKGAYATIHLTCDPRIQRTFISSTDNDFNLVTYHVTQFEFGITFKGSWGTNCCCRNATPEEIQELNDQLEAEGKRWNPVTMQIEKLKWKPMYNDKYYCVNLASLSFVVCHTWTGDTIDYDYYDQNNCFKTKEEAEAKLKRIKKILAQ